MAFFTISTRSAAVHLLLFYKKLEGMNALDSDLISPFRNGTILALLKQCKVEMCARTPYCRNDEVAEVSDLVAMIGISGDNDDGFISLRSSKYLYL